MTPEPICPCCRQPMPPQLRISPEAGKRVAEAVAAATGPMLARVIQTFLRNFGQPIPRSRLVEILYADDPDGGPDDANSVTAVHVNRARKRLQPFGLEIVGRSWNGSVLRWKAPEGET